MYFLCFLLQQPDEDLMTLGLQDLRTAACRIFREPKPRECHGLNSANSVNAMTFGIAITSVALIGFSKLF